ncbi:hypothetical protein [Malaciobacter halophilus]|uniref:hypothetical protein n=1 Tax=Malaciobacter halophilus TaxID=197482 RepID=UPI000C336A5B|nr:hypothetical protein [Malaciobacter halophilus]
MGSNPTRRAIYPIYPKKSDFNKVKSVKITTYLQLFKEYLKTDSEFNRNAVIGTKEVIEELTAKEVANFNRGRSIIKDGISSQKDLIQVPFISQNQHLALVKAFDYLK